MTNSFLIVLLTKMVIMPATYSIPCQAKCYYEDETTTPCWDPYASTLAYQSESGNCLCCPSGTLCSTCKTMTSIEYSYGYEMTSSRSPLSCLCSKDAQCQVNDACAKCDTDTGNCIPGERCPDGTCKIPGMDCTECTEDSDCFEYMTNCAKCVDSKCQDYFCPIYFLFLVCGSPGFDCGVLGCFADTDCLRITECAKCAENGICYNTACPNGKCERSGGTGSCPSSTTTTTSSVVRN